MGAWMTPGILNSTSYTLVIAGAFARIVTSFAALPPRNNQPSRKAASSAMGLRAMNQ